MLPVRYRQTIIICIYITIIYIIHDSVKNCKSFCEKQKTKLRGRNNLRCRCQNPIFTRAAAERAALSQPVRLRVRPGSGRCGRSETRRAKRCVSGPESPRHVVAILPCGPRFFHRMQWRTGKMMCPPCTDRFVLIQFYASGWEKCPAQQISRIKNHICRQLLLKTGQGFIVTQM